jgi:hypothetical protein
MRARLGRLFCPAGPSEMLSLIWAPISESSEDDMLARFDSNSSFWGIVGADPRQSVPI